MPQLRLEVTHAIHIPCHPEDDMTATPDGLHLWIHNRGQQAWPGTCTILQKEHAAPGVLHVNMTLTPFSDLSYMTMRIPYPYTS
jgi:hypothetical protein